MEALQFLSVKDPKRLPVYALVGDEDFLKRHARERIISIAIGDEDPSFAVAVYAGDRLDFSTARNELETLPFLAPCRVVIVEGADKFVTDNRPALEAYAAKPSAVGVLVLDVKTLPENTKLAKALPDAAKIACKGPPVYKLGPWCVEWAKTAHKKKLATEAAELLIERVGGSMGLLDQELGKLANAVGGKPSISAEDVSAGGPVEGADVFRILDAIGEGRPGQALSILEELFAEGEDPMAVMGPLTAQLRKLATVGPVGRGGQAGDGPGDGRGQRAQVGQGPDRVREAVETPRRRPAAQAAGLAGRDQLRAEGGNPLPERVQVERLIVMLARPREDAKRA
jgi:DNA polymerase-3 subunit delta